MRKVLFAIGEEHYAQILRKNLSEKTDSFQIIDDEIYHFEYVDEAVQNYLPDMLIIHDFYLSHSYDDERTRQTAILNLFRQFRERYDDQVRVVYLCERSISDPFLAELVSVNVLDIFHQRNIKADELVRQLNEPPRYSNVKKFTISTTHGSHSGLSNHKQTHDADAEDGEEESTSDSGNKASTHDGKGKTKEKVKVKEKVVVRDRVVHTSSMMVGIVNVSMKAGSSFVTSLIAKGLAENELSVSVYDIPSVQPGKTFLYDLLGFHLTFQDDYQSLHHHYRESETLTKHTLSRQEHEKINWHVYNPHLNPIDDWEAAETIDLSHFFSDAVTLVDIGYLSISEHQRILRYFDHVFFVCDVSPHELDANVENIRYFQQNQDSINGHLVLNRWDSSLKKKWFRKLFPNQKPFTLPFLPYGQVVNSFFNRRIPFHLVKEDEHAEGMLRGILNTLFPQLTFENKNGLLHRLFKSRRYEEVQE